MISISDKSQDISNSKQRPMTVILFSFNRNITRTELKNTLGVKKGKLLQGRKKHATVAGLFDKLFAVRAASPAEGVFFNYQKNNSLSHIYLVDQGTCLKEFAILKYGNQLLGGFNVCISELEELQDLLEAYRKIAFSCNICINSVKALSNTFDTITNSQLIDLCKYKDLLSPFAQELNNLTCQIISLAKDKVDDWFDRHSWKDVDLTSEAVADKLI